MDFSRAYETVFLTFPHKNIEQSRYVVDMLRNGVEKCKKFPSSAENVAQTMI